MLDTIKKISLIMRLFVMMKRYFNKLRFYNLIDYFNVDLLTKLLYIIITILIIFIIYYFNLVLDLIRLIYSFLIFHFIFNKFTYSNNKYIKFLQELIMYYLCFYICIYLFPF